MNFKFRSLNVLFGEAFLTFKRFPVVIVVGIICASLGIWMVEVPSLHNQFLVRVLTIFTMGIPFSFAITLFFEKEGVGRVTKWAAAFLAVGSLVFLFLSYEWSTPTVFAFRTFQFNIAIHLLVAFILFVPRGSLPGFWLFNELLFVRFITAVIYSAVIYLGLAAALGATHYLLGFETSGRPYIWLWIIVSYVFNTWFFLGKIPRREVADLQEIATYPPEIKIFTQYVLIPLVTLYCLILYAYLAKILITWTWPKGMVGYLVSSVSLVGIFSLLLVHPVQHLAENKWIRVYSRGFYLALFPLLVLLFMGTWKRIADYGFTEKRYYLMVLDFWIAAMAFYFTFSRGRNIKLIPISLCLVAVLSGIGPWSAFEVSRRNQFSRLKANLERVGVLVDGKPVKTSNVVEYDTLLEISEQVRYLNEKHGNFLQQLWFPDLEKVSAENISQPMMEAMGMQYQGKWRSQSQSQSLNKKPFFFSAPSKRSSAIMNVAGFDALLRFEAHEYAAPKNLSATFTYPEGKHYSFLIKKGSTVLELLNDQQVSIAQLRLDSFIEKVRKTSLINEEDCVLTHAGQDFNLRVTITGAQGEEENNVLTLQSFTADVLLKRN